MLKRTLPLLAFAAFAMPAAAGNRVFVANNGNDANACTQAAPCASFNAAINAAGANGSIVCLDRGSYMTTNLMFITASVSILCGDGLGDLGTGHLIINTTAADKVVLEGIVGDAQGAGGDVIATIGAGTLHIRNATLRRSGTGSGINFQPSGAGTLFVTDSVIDSNHLQGISIFPTGSGYANVHITNVKVDNNQVHGLDANGTTSSTGINVNIVGGSASSNGVVGIAATSIASSAPVTISVKGTQISGNLVSGLSPTNSNQPTIKVGNSQITANARGLGAGGSSKIFSLGGNQLHSNSVDGTFSGAIATQ